MNNITFYAYQTFEIIYTDFLKIILYLFEYSYNYIITKIILSYHFIETLMNEYNFKNNAINYYDNYIKSFMNNIIDSSIMIFNTIDFQYFNFIQYISNVGKQTQNILLSSTRKFDLLKYKTMVLLILLIY